MVLGSSFALLGLFTSLFQFTSAAAVEKRQAACPSDTVCNTLTLTWASRAPDGQSRNVVLINGQFIGPLLRINQGQKVQYTVVNNTPYNQTVHWHGIEQLNTPYSDGVPGVSQRPIPPNGQFVYKWTATEYGMYWYHAHDDSFLSDGLYGPLLINPSASTTKPFDIIDASAVSQIVAAEASPNIAMVADWSHRPSQELMKIEQDVNLDINCLDSVLINGKGNSYCLSREKIDTLTNPMLSPVLGDQKLTDKGCIPANISLVQGDFPKDFSKLPDDVFDVCTPSSGSQQVYNVDASKGFAVFHFVNSGVINLFTVAIDEHQMWVFQVDGRYITPNKVDAFTISPGTRVSVVVPLTQQAANYQIRFANPGLDQLLFGNAMMSYRGGDTSYKSNATINEAGEGLISPLVRFDNNNYKIFPPSKPSATSDRTYHLTIDRSGASWKYTLSGKEAYDQKYENEEPLLFNPNSTLGQDRNLTITTNFGEWVDLIVHVPFPPVQPGHPLHKHNNKAYIIGFGSGDFPGQNVAEALEASPQNFNLIDPPLRDGFLTPDAIGVSSWMVIRYKVENPGAWLMHCHTQTHAAGGMTLAILDGIDRWPTVPGEFLDASNASTASNAPNSTGS